MVWLDEDIWFPDPYTAPADFPLAFGGDLSPERLLFAYSLGIFPWYSEGEPIMW
ncbi:MAG TPA: leucyl/phenylalanyl-tRNA--protein transferase, partial [Persephonella sp.]|nr:leucyl/phenylalanyl-tRNA--protein transferase [Persephonella sp.]